MTADERIRPILRDLLRSGMTANEILDQIEAKLIRLALEDANGNVTAASRALGWHRNTLINKRRHLEAGENTKQLRAMERAHRGQLRKTAKMGADLRNARERARKNARSKR